MCPDDGLVQTQPAREYEDNEVSGHPTFFAILAKGGLVMIQQFSDGA